MTSAEFMKLVIKILHPLGYRRKSSRWYRDTDECRLILFVQKSRWGGGKLYIELSVQVLAPNDDRDLSHWDINRRLSLYEDDRPYFLMDLLDLGSDISDDSREEGLRWVLADVAVPWVEKLGTVEGIRGALDESKLHPSDIWSERVKQMVGIK